MKPTTKFQGNGLAVLFLAICFAACQPRYAIIDSEDYETLAKPIDWKPRSVIEARLGPLQMVSHDPKDDAQRAHDSLSATGIDSFIVFVNTQNNYWWATEVFMKGRGKHLIRTPLKPKSDCEPAYLFWCHEGRYFLQRFDRFDRYAAIERSFMDHYPLYDYPRWQGDSIRLQLLHHTPPRIDDPIPNYSMIVNFNDQASKGSDICRTEMEFHCGDLEMKLHFSHEFRQPQPYDSASAVEPTIGNNIRTYTHNASLADWMWQRLLMAEIGEVEALHLFRVVGE